MPGSDHPWRRKGSRTAKGAGVGGQANGPGRSRQPFEPGNLVAMTSGAYSPRITDPYAQALAAWAREQDALHFLADPSFAPSVWRWATRTAMADLLLDRLTAHHDDDGGACSGCGVCTSLEERWHRADRAAERAGERLGLDPQSRAELLVKLRQAGVIESEAEQAKSMLGQLWSALQITAVDLTEEGRSLVETEVVSEDEGQ